LSNDGNIVEEAESMKVQLGPCPVSKIVLCSADAGPKSQGSGRDEAGFFFKGAAWVGAVRNAAAILGCKFVILTTAHGMVNSSDVIERYDMHIIPYRSQVAQRWERSIPQVLGRGRFSLMVFYAGGCPRELYMDLLIPILRDLGVSLITFGRPNMYDIGKLEEFVDLITKSITMEGLASILKHPEELEFIPALT